MKKQNILLVEIICMVTAIVLDRLTKYLAVEYLKPIGSLPIIKDVIHLTYVENRGASFGMLSDHRWVFMSVSTVAIIAILAVMIVLRKKIGLVCGLSLAFIAGGGVGNMIDRIVLGYVVDFIDFTLIDFAVFNVADSFVVVGTVIFAVYLLFFEGKSKDESIASR